MCRIATVNNARYEWDEHAPLLEGTGFRKDSFSTTANKDFMGTEGEVLQTLNPRQVAVFRYADAMTKIIAVPEPITEEFRRLLQRRRLLSTATVAGYNCASRFLVPLNVGDSQSNTVRFQSSKNTRL